MVKIDVISGFLGAGKTTLIKKLLLEALSDTKVVLIENEFGEIGIDGGFLKEAGIEIKEMNSGCICCSLVGDFGESLKEVLTKYSPERVLIEPSGVGKLSDVLTAIEKVGVDLDIKVSSAVAVVDASKCKSFMKNFGEFYVNQIQYAGTIILTRGDKTSEEQINQCVEMIRQHNTTATIITTQLNQLDGKTILDTIEGTGTLDNMMKELLHEHENDIEHVNDHEHGEDCSCGCHDHNHHHDHEHHHEHHHEHEEDCTCGCHDHDHHDHEHGEDCTCGCGGHDHHHEHGHHHADEVFTSWGIETPNTYSKTEIEDILTALDSGDYGMVLRAKGMVAGEDGTWIYYDYVPEEHEVRSGKPDVTGKICVIGSNIKEDKLIELFKK